MTPLDEQPPRLPRRKVLQMFAAATAAAGGSLDSRLFGAETVAANGYGTDPVLTKVYAPGDIWPLTLSEGERKAAAALCDLIIPEDDLGPAASAVGVPEFIDEWVSAPYPAQQRDRPAILEGLAWIDAEATKRFGKSFAGLDAAGKVAIADDICDPDKATPEFSKAARFFEKFKTLAAGGYYSTQPGWKAIGFVGNLPTVTFDGPPPEVLRMLEVEQTVV
ncbi:MAG: gluconate 2-dehydrogenase subunit 3 family protein [Verrucomicrobiae bacterium]|nr:gluconate 2-dehydrogenase subunit 3 family protein [Verrucomicrobiae bacterium]